MTGARATAPPAPLFDAVVLAGGRSTRLDGRAKADLALDGARLVDRAVGAAVAAGARRTVVVGPEELEVAGAIATRERPPFGGPVAAIAAGLAALAAAETATAAGATATAETTAHGGPADGDARDLGSERGRAPWVLVLSCDLVRPAAATAALVEALASLAGEPARPAAEGTVSEGMAAEASGLHLDDGRPQWLVAIYRRDALERSLAALGDPAGAAVRALVGSLDLVAVADPDGLSADVDTWQDVEHARRLLEEDSMSNAPLAPEALDAWLAAVAAELGVDPAAVSIPVVLDLARDVAHGVARPAAPLTAFVVGLAAGAGLGSPGELSARAAALAERWPAEGSTPDPRDA